MSIEVIHPRDKDHWLECRTKDITSTEVGALFGISPYLTEFELWNRKRNGNIVKIEENERMKWGTALQDAIAAEIAKEQGITVRRMDEYIRDTELRIGSSFDFSIEGETLGLLEIKNVDSLQFRDGWVEDSAGNLEAPLHIEIQVQHQLLVSDREYAIIGALVGGNNLQQIKRTPNETVFAAIRDRVAQFWHSIEENNPPKPDFIRDARFISKLYGYAEPGKVMNIQGEEILAKAQEYKRLADVAKEAEEKRKAIKAELLTIIGDSEKAIGDGFKISASIVAGGPVSYVKDSYRDFRITWSKK